MGAGSSGWVGTGSLGPARAPARVPRVSEPVLQGSGHQEASSEIPKTHAALGLSQKTHLFLL